MPLVYKNSTNFQDAHRSHISQHKNVLNTATRALPSSVSVCTQCIGAGRRTGPKLARPVLVRKSRKLPTLLAICFRTRLLGPCSGSPAIGWFANIDRALEENNRSRPVIRPLGVSHLLELDPHGLHRTQPVAGTLNPAESAAGLGRGSHACSFPVPAGFAGDPRLRRRRSPNPEVENDGLRDRVNHLEGRICARRIRSASSPRFASG